MLSRDVGFPEVTCICDKVQLSIIKFIVSNKCITLFSVSEKVYEIPISRSTKFHRFRLFSFCSPINCCCKNAYRLFKLTACLRVQFFSNLAIISSYACVFVGETGRKSSDFSSATSMRVLHVLRHWSTKFPEVNIISFFRH